MSDESVVYEDAPTPLKKLNKRERILSIDDTQSEMVTIHEWADEEVLVVGLTGKERADLLDKAMVDGELDFKVIYPDLVIMGAYDPETRSRIFEPTDREALMSKSAAATEAIAQVVMRLSGMDPKGKKKGRNG